MHFILVYLYYFSVIMHGKRLNIKYGTYINDGLNIELYFTE